MQNKNCIITPDAYIIVDSILSKIVSHRGNVWRVIIAGQNNISYIVTDGNGKYAHGDSLAEAREDLIYKIGDRDKSSYEHLTIYSVLPYSDMIECYRVITGSCALGVKNFMKTIEKKDSYSIGDVIELTNGAYGGDTFKEFFKKRG
jgi:hypothetical protein